MCERVSMSCFYFNINRLFSWSILWFGWISNGNTLGVLSYNCSRTTIGSKCLTTKCGRTRQRCYTRRNSSNFNSFSSRFYSYWWFWICIWITEEEVCNKITPVIWDKIYICDCCNSTTCFSNNFRSFSNITIKWSFWICKPSYTKVDKFWCWWITITRTWAWSIIRINCIFFNKNRRWT